MGLSVSDRLLDVKKGACATIKFKHWDNNSKSCEWNECLCANGFSVDKEKCPEHNLKVCLGCNIDYQLGNLRTWSTQHPIFGRLAISKPVGDCTYKKCSCSSGTGKMGKECKFIGYHDCKTCSSGYHMEKQGSGSNVVDRCLINRCTCPNGHGHTGTSCHKHGAFKCKGCNSSHQLINGKCVYKRCGCHKGTAKHGAACRGHGLTHCSSCNRGYRMKKYSHGCTKR